jgi:hypothetical protein
MSPCDIKTLTDLAAYLKSKIAKNEADKKKSDKKHSPQDVLAGMWERGAIHAYQDALTAVEALMGSKPDLLAKVRDLYAAVQSYDHPNPDKLINPIKLAPDVLLLYKPGRGSLPSPEITICIWPEMAEKTPCPHRSWNQVGVDTECADCGLLIQPLHRQLAAGIDPTVADLEWYLVWRYEDDTSRRQSSARKLFFRANRPGTKGLPTWESDPTNASRYAHKEDADRTANTYNGRVIECLVDPKTGTVTKVGT